MNVQYIGFFLNLETTNYLREVATSYGVPLSKQIDDLHVTFSFKPKTEMFERFSKFLGKNAEVHVIGYSNDGLNEGFLVAFPETFEEELQEIYKEKGAKHPHFTLSIEAEKRAKAKDTVSLFDREDVVYLPTPISVSGVLGFKTWSNETVFSI